MMIRDRVLRAGVTVGLFLVAFFAVAQTDVINTSIETFLVGPGGNLVPATRGNLGDVVEYHLSVRNVSGEPLPSGIVVLTIPIAVGTTFVEDSLSTHPGRYTAWVEFSSNGTDFLPVSGPDSKILRWTLLDTLEPDAAAEVRYRVVIGGQRAPSTPSPGFATDLDAFTQAMFGHLGVIQIDCPSWVEGVYFCGEASTAFPQFMRQWDLYADWSGRVPVVPDPLSAWRRSEGDSYARLYALAGERFLVTFDDGYVIIGR